MRADRTLSMAAPKFRSVPAEARWIESYRSPDYIPPAWRAERPGDLTGRQPSGPQLGFQGPDQGYAYKLARYVEPSLIVSAGEDADDAVAGCAGIALRRASIFGRAPVIHDVRIAFTLWGFCDPAPPAELVGLRRSRFEGAADPQHYELVRALADEVPEATLRLAPAEVAARYPAQWRALLRLE